MLADAIGIHHPLPPPPHSAAGWGSQTLLRLVASLQ